MKGRGRQLTLSQPGVALVSEQSIAEKPAAIAHDSIFKKISWVADQDFLDQIRMIQKINVKPRGPVIEDVAVLTCPRSENRERIGAGQRHVADKKFRSRAWWTGEHLRLKQNGICQTMVPFDFAQDSSRPS